MNNEQLDSATHAICSLVQRACIEQPEISAEQLVALAEAAAKAIKAGLAVLSEGI